MRNENLFERDNSSPATISPIIFEKAGRPTNSRGRPKTDHPNLCESLVLPTAKYRCISIYSPLPLSLFPLSLSLSSVSFDTIYRFLRARFCTLPQIKSTPRHGAVNERGSVVCARKPGKGEQGGIFKFAFTPRSQTNPPLLSALDNELPALQTTAPSK